MSGKFSAYLKVRNNTQEDLTDIQVVLRNGYLYLFQYGNVEAQTWAKNRYGIITASDSSDSSDFWTVTYTKNGVVWWVFDKERFVEKADASKNIEITIYDTKIKVFCPGSGKSGSWTITQPGL